MKTTLDTAEIVLFIKQILFIIIVFAILIIISLLDINIYAEKLYYYILYNHILFPDFQSKVPLFD